MNQKAKPEFEDYGIMLAKVGDSCGDILTAAHSGKLHFVGDANTLPATKALLPVNATIMEFATPPKANDKTAEKIRAETSSADAIIAVGSGTMNDLCKYASFLDGKPYSVIATAPSMNGYVSANASITVDGYKSTLPAHAPVAVICDLDILSNAPERLIQAGIGDTLCRSTVQADWLLSHLLLNTPYDATYFDWVAQDEKFLLSSLRGSEADAAIQNGGDITRLPRFARNDELMEALINSLLLSGIAMRENGSSAPASQGEHMIAHTMEMLNPSLPHSYHGEQIAVTSLTMAKRQGTLLAKDTPPLVTPSPPLVTPSNDGVWAAFSESIGKEASQQFQQKLPDDEAIESLNAKLAKEWPSMREQIKNITLPATQLEQALQAAGCPTQSQDIGWDNSEYKKAVSLARFTRNRFTFLDLSL